MASQDRPMASGNSEGISAPFRDRLASSLIGTPLQGPVMRMRRLHNLYQMWRYPDLKKIFMEGDQARELMRRTITSEMNCVDVGCHLGSVLVDMMKFAPAGRHTAVEAVPYKAEWLRRKFPTVAVHQIAVSDHEGTSRFYIDHWRSGFSGLTNRGDSPSISVECKRLDDVVAPGTRVGFLKIDVEGHEIAALRGARRILSEGRPLVLFEWAGTRAEPPERLFEFFAEIEYGCWLIKDRLAGRPPLDLPHFQEARTFPFSACNFIAAPLA